MAEDREDLLRRYRESRAKLLQAIESLTDEQNDVHNATGYELRRSMSAAQARWELETSRRKLLDAITAATPPALDPTRYGGADLRSDHEDEHAGWIARWRGEKGI